MTVEPDTPKGTPAEWIVDRVLRGLIRHALRLPYERRVPRFGGIVAKGIAPLAGYRKRARTQLELIWPDMPHAERDELALRACDNFGRTMIENYSRPDFADKVCESSPTGEGLEAIADARAQGRPVIFVTGHFGNFEAPRQMLTRMGYTIGGYYRPMSNPYFNAHYEQTMIGVSGPVFSQGRKGTIGFAKMLKQGGMGTLLYDVRYTPGPQLDFMGRPAYTSISAAEFALRFDALMVPYFGTRRADGLGFDVAIEAPIPHSDALTMTGEANDRLAARIRAHPDQWFWVHKRWG